MAVESSESRGILDDAERVVQRENLQVGRLGRWRCLWWTGPQRRRGGGNRRGRRDAFWLASSRLVHQVRLSAAKLTPTCLTSPRQMSLMISPFDVEGPQRKLACFGSAFSVPIGRFLCVRMRVVSRCASHDGKWPLCRGNGPASELLSHWWNRNSVPLQHRPCAVQKYPSIRKENVRRDERRSRRKMTPAGPHLHCAPAVTNVRLSYSSKNRVGLLSYLHDTEDDGDTSARSHGHTEETSPMTLSENEREKVQGGHRSATVGSTSIGPAHSSYFLIINWWPSLSARRCSSRCGRSIVPQLLIGATTLRRGRLLFVDPARHPPYVWTGDRWARRRSIRYLNRWST